MENENRLYPKNNYKLAGQLTILGSKNVPETLQTQTSQLPNYITPTLSECLNALTQTEYIEIFGTQNIRGMFVSVTNS